MKKDKATHNVPDEQWDWYAGFSTDGKMLTLREYVKSHNTIPLENLTHEQVTALTIARIEVQPKFDISVMGANQHQRIHKALALQHLQEEASVAPFLRSIELRVLRELIPRARKEANKL